MTSPQSQPHTAVMLMAYGTLATAMKSSPITPISDGVASQLLPADLVARYEAIGHRWLNSPNVSNNVCSRNSTRSTLAATVELGLKHADPKLRHLSSNSPPRVPQDHRTGPCPHYSTYSVGQYLDRTRTAAEPHGISVSGVDSQGQSLHLLSSSPTILRLVSNRCHQTSMSSSPLTHCLNELLIQVTPIRMNFAPLHRQLLLESASRRQRLVNRWQRRTNP